MFKLGRLLSAAFALLVPCTALAHHGGVSLAFGPGSPVETNSPLTLPEGGFVIGVRAEQVEWKKFDQFQPNNKPAFTFFNANMSFGFTPAAMGTFIVPYYVKRQDELGSNKGLSDAKFLFTYGFHHDPGAGFSRNTAEDTAVSLEGKKRTYMAVSFMYSLPTANVHRKLADGSSDPGMQTGFGGAAYTMGISAARAFGAFTVNGEVSADLFTEKDNFQFGTEARVNVAGVYELYGNTKSALSKLDGILELNFLHLGRDREFGDGLPGTGGDILYLSPGARFSFPGLQNANLGLLVKMPIWKDLNEEKDQQGAEGLEKYRVIATMSLFF